MAYIREFILPAPHKVLGLHEGAKFLGFGSQGATGMHMPLCWWLDDDLNPSVDVSVILVQTDEFVDTNSIYHEHLASCIVGHAGLHLFRVLAASKS